MQNSSLGNGKEEALNGKVFDAQVFLIFLTIDTSCDLMQGHGILQMNIAFEFGKRLANSGITAHSDDENFTMQFLYLESEMDMGQVL